MAYVHVQRPKSHFLLWQDNGFLFTLMVRCDSKHEILRVRLSFTIKTSTFNYLSSHCSQWIYRATKYITPKACKQWLVSQIPAHTLLISLFTLTTVKAHITLLTTPKTSDYKMQLRPKLRDFIWEITDEH